MVPLWLSTSFSRERGGGLAAAGLAHQPQRLAGVKIETDVFHRVHPASDPIEQSAAQIKARNQMLHPQDRRGAWRHGILRRRIPRRPAAETSPAAADRPSPQLRHRRQQRPGIGLLRRGEQLAHPILLHLLTAAHHQHPVGDLRHHAHVVSDEDHPHLHFPLQHADQLQDLRLDGDVEGGSGLIGDQQRWPAGERHGDHHALAHAAGKLVRVAPQHLFGLRNAHQVEHAQRLLARAAAIHALMQAQRFGDLLADRKHRVERGHRLLEDHRHVGTTHRAQRTLRGLSEIEQRAVTSAQRHGTADDAPAALLHQPHQPQRSHRFTGAGLTDDRQRLAALEIERQVTHRCHGAVRLRKADAQIAHRQHPLRR